VKIFFNSIVSMRVNNLYVQKRCSSVKGKKTAKVSLGGTSSSMFAFVRRSMIVESRFCVAAIKGSEYVPRSRLNESLNNCSEVFLKTLGYNQCSKPQSSSRLFWTGVPVRTSLKSVSIGQRQVYAVTYPNETSFRCPALCVRCWSRNS
jgi:hypothetical protein